MYSHTHTHTHTLAHSGTAPPVLGLHPEGAAGSPNPRTAELSSAKHLGGSDTKWCRPRHTGALSPAGAGQAASDGWVFSFPRTPRSLAPTVGAPPSSHPQNARGRGLACGRLPKRPPACSRAGRGTEAELALCLKNIHPSSCSSVLILFFPNQFLKVKMTDRFLLWAVVLLIK